MTHGDEAPIQAVDPVVARALRSMSGMERLRLGHESWELARDRLTAYFAHTSIQIGLPTRSAAGSPGGF
jgi:hypothetical protein